MPPLNIGQLAVGERLQHELLVVDRVEKTQPNGDPYWVLTLGNASGRLDTSPIWSNQREWAEGAQRGSVVQAIGHVGLYPKTGKRQTSSPGRCACCRTSWSTSKRSCRASRALPPSCGLDGPSARRDTNPVVRAS